MQSVADDLAGDLRPDKPVLFRSDQDAAPSPAFVDGEPEAAAGVLCGGLAAITGAYLAGVLIGRTATRERLVELTNFMGYAFFAPVFFATVGMTVCTEDLRAAPGFALALILLAILTKAAGCAAGALLCGFRPRESLTVGVGMISRGEVALAVAALGLSEGTIDQRAFSTAVVMTLVTTLITPVLLKAMLARRVPRPALRVGGSPSPLQAHERIETERPVRT